MGSPPYGAAPSHFARGIGHMVTVTKCPPLTAKLRRLPRSCSKNQATLSYSSPRQSVNSQQVLERHHFPSSQKEAAPRPTFLTN